MKVSVIKEARDIITIKVDEMFNSLLTFEMAIIDKSKKRNKSVVFKADIEDDDDKQVKEDINDNLSESICTTCKDI